VALDNNWLDSNRLDSNRLDSNRLDSNRSAEKVPRPRSQSTERAEQHDRSVLIQSRHPRREPVAWPADTAFELQGTPGQSDDEPAENGKKPTPS
jgi:hypothetical protein